MRGPFADTLVLCYHGVSEDWPAEIAVSPRQIEAQLEWLVSRGYRGATFHEAVHDPPSQRTLAVTFDDAYRSVRELAEPILTGLGLAGTVFVPTAFAGTTGPMSWPGIDSWLGGPHESELEPLSWEELAGLAGRGWEIGSHTQTHPHLTEISDSDLAAELEGSRRTCEEMLQRPCRSIAYPHGDVDQRVVDAAERAGYTAGAAVPSPFLHPEARLRWPRVGVQRSEGDDAFRLKVSPMRRRIRASRAAPTLAALYRLRRVQDAS